MDNKSARGASGVDIFPGIGQCSSCGWVDLRGAVTSEQPSPQYPSLGSGSSSGARPRRRWRRVLLSVAVAFPVLLIGLLFVPARWFPGFHVGDGRGRLSLTLGRYALPADARLRGETYDGREHCDFGQWIGMSCPDGNYLSRTYETNVPASRLCAEIMGGTGGLQRAPDWYTADPGAGCFYRFDLDSTTSIGGEIDAGTPTLLVVDAQSRPASQG